MQRVGVAVERLIERVYKVIDIVSGGKEIVRLMEYEMEFEMEEIRESERVQDVVNSTTAPTRDAIRRAQDLTQTHAKTVIQISKAATYKKPIYLIRIWSIASQLYTIQHQMLKAGYIKMAHDLLSIGRIAPSYIERCICYFLLFPPDFQVPSRRLIALWVAEGLFYSNQSAEQVAELILDEMVRLGLIDVTRNRSGKVKTCMIDAPFRTQILDEATGKFILDKDGNSRRLVDTNGGIQIDGSPIIPTNFRDVISFLSFNTQEGSKPGEDIGDFLRKCIAAGCFMWLRVLDLERVFRPQLPDTLGKLLALKYLGLRWTYLEQLPHSVDKLFNLQVLDVKHTYISVLPTSIWTMEFLRHLYLSEAYRTRFPHPPSRITLTALQTLWGAFVDEDTCVIRGLDTLLNIRKLGLSCLQRPSKHDHMAKQLKAIDTWISRLDFLETLRLKSRDESGKAADLHLTSLAGNRKLSTVYLLGRLDRLILCKLPASLTDITLSGSALELDPLPFLGRLPNLVTLRLLAQSVVCSNMYFPRKGFRRLKFLWIWKLENLVEFEAQEGSLPCLEELEIRSCNKLGKLPHHHQNLNIKLTSMPREFIQKLKGKYTKVEHILQDDQYICTNAPTRSADEAEASCAAKDE